MIGKSLQYSNGSVHQVLPSFARYDAIGCETLAIRKRLQERGFESEIFFEREIGSTCRFSKPFTEFNFDPNCRGVIYHHSVGSSLPMRLLAQQPPKVVTLYHNITPPEYFASLGDHGAADSCREGVRQLDLLRVFSSYGWADSSYNALDLKDVGFSRVEVLPIFRDFNALTKLDPDPELLMNLGSSTKNILFVGRLTPNKAQHRLLRYASILKCKGYRLRLILPGGQHPLFRKEIVSCALKLGLAVGFDLKEASLAKDVVLPGQISDREMATLYRSARVFMCASEHEGFCVPLVEAMFFSLPIIANPRGAVPETLSQSGLLVEINDERAVTEALKRVLDDDDLATELAEKSRRESLRFQFERLVSRFDELVDQAFQDAEPWSLSRDRFSISPEADNSI